MGRDDKEPKTLVEGDDYWIMKLDRGQVAPRGWIARRRLKREFTPELLQELLAPKRGGIFVMMSTGTGLQQVFPRRTYLLMKGPKPDAKWGPLCP